MKERIISLCLVGALMLSGCASATSPSSNSSSGQSNEEEIIEMKNIVIFGDSYSTFDGYIPKENLTYYPSYNVLEAEQTWWGQLVEKTGANLVLNDSWSGSTICNTGYYGGDCSRTNSFIYRYEKLQKEGFFEKNEVDTIFVFGGTNDSWAESPLGERMSSGWTDTDLYYVLPAISYFMDTLKADLPEANIIFIVNTEIKEEITFCMEWAADYFGVKVVRLNNVQKKDGHPTAKGMTTICDQIMGVLFDLG